MNIEKDDLIEIDYILSLTKVTRKDAERLLTFAQKFIDKEMKSCSTCSSQIRSLYKKVKKFIDKNTDRIEDSRKSIELENDETGDR